MEDMMQHYKKQQQSDCEMFDTVYQQLQTTKEELSETKAQLLEVLQLGKTQMSDAEAAGRSKEEFNELLKQVNSLKEELNISVKKYDCLVEEHNKWKLEYARLSKECEEYKAHLAKGKLMKENLERENQDLTTRVNTLANRFVASETSSKDYPISDRQKRISSLEKEVDSIKVEYAKLMKKLKDTEETLDSFRRNQGAMSDNESLQQELAWMKEKMVEVEGKYTNYTSLEQENTVLRKEVEDLCRQVTVARSTHPTPTVQQPTPVSQPEVSMNSR